MFWQSIDTRLEMFWQSIDTRLEMFWANTHACIGEGGGGANHKVFSVRLKKTIRNLRTAPKHSPADIQIRKTTGNYQQRKSRYWRGTTRT